jgi:fatty-acyl-CoA synthase
MQSLYGSSEVQGLYSVQNDVDDPKVRLDPGGVPVAPDAKVRTRSLTDGSILPHGEPGELQFSGPSVFAGYYNDPDATRKALDPEGWFSSGDLGFTLADGSFRFMSRIGDALRLSGYLVNPAEIEECIQEFPGVSQCQVVGVDLDGATVPVAFYTGDPKLDEAAMTQHCRDAMARYKVPKRILHLESFPTVTSANNTKVRRVELRELAQKALGK